MKHLFLFTLVCSATNLFGQHVASSSLSVMRNARAFSTLSSVRSTMAFDAQSVQKKRTSKPFDNNIARNARAFSSSGLVSKNYTFEEARPWEVNRRPNEPGDSCFVGALILGFFPAATFTPLFLMAGFFEPKFFFAVPAVWGVSTLMSYQEGKAYELVLDKHHELAGLATEVMEDSFKHTFIKAVLPLHSNSNLKQDFERYVEQKGVSQEIAFKEVENIHKNFAAVFTDRRYIVDESLYKETFDKVKAMRDELALVLATIAPENALHNERKMKYAYTHTPEHVTNRVQSSD